MRLSEIAFSLRYRRLSKEGWRALDRNTSFVLASRIQKLFPRAKMHGRGRREKRVRIHRVQSRAGHVTQKGPCGQITKLATYLATSVIPDLPKLSAAKRRLYNLLERTVHIYNAITARQKRFWLLLVQINYPISSKELLVASNANYKARSLELPDLTARALSGHVSRTALYRVDPDSRRDFKCACLLVM